MFEETAGKEEQRLRVQVEAKARWVETESEDVALTTTRARRKRRYSHCMGKKIANARPIRLLARLRLRVRVCCAGVCILLRCGPGPCRLSCLSGKLDFSSGIGIAALSLFVCEEKREKKEVGPKLLYCTLGSVSLCV